MVRLKVISVNGITACKYLSIPVWCDWREHKQSHPHQTTSLSIPVWCDWRITPAQMLKKTAFFQFQYGAIEGCWRAGRLFRGRLSIPVWCDWRKEEAIRYIKRKPLSIPVWCDWRYLLLSVINIWSSFQFQYGAIEGTSVDTSTGSFSTFNSSMVRLKVRHNYDPVHVIPLSISVWCDWRYFQKFKAGWPV